METSELFDGRQLRRRALLTPCGSKEGLRRWLRMFLNLDFPDTVIDPESTGSPMDIFWEIYNAGVTRDPNYPRRVMIYASRDSYKCQVKGTKVLSVDGIKNIEDAKVGDTLWSGRNWRKVTDWVHDGTKNGLRLTLKDGHTSTGSPIHRVWAWRSGRMPEWIALKDLAPADLVMVDAGVVWGQAKEESEEYKRGYILGALAGDGCLTLMDSHKKVCLTASDEVVRQAWVEFCVKEAGRVPVMRPSRRYDYWICSVDLCERLRAYGCLPHYSHEKRVPWAGVSSRSSMAGFLSGLLDTDGTVTGKNNIEIPITSKGLLDDCLLLFNALGVNAYIRSNTKKYGIQNHVVHRLVVKARDFDKMAASGIRFTASKAQKVRVRQDKTKDTHDGFPVGFVAPLLNVLPKDGGRGKRSSKLKPKVSALYPSVSREKVGALLDWAAAHGHLPEKDLAEWRFIADHRWSPIKSIEACQADFYDLTVEDDHSYWSNGVVSHNTLGASALEILAMLHMNRSLVHMAAIEQQSSKAQEYLKGFLDRDDLSEFKTGDNKRTVAVCWFEEKTTGDIYTLKEWTDLGGRALRGRFTRHVHYAKILVNTPQSANSDHTAWMCVDELDLIRFPKAYKESLFIPGTQTDVYGNKQPPITVITSTRKSSGGLVQKEIDNAAKTGLKVHHWNVLDVTSACPTDRHRPDLPKLNVFRSDDTLLALTPEEFKELEAVDPKKAATYVEAEAYHGCMANCKIFAACKGYLANQKSKSKMLKELSDTVGKFAENDVDMALAQLLCRKPGRSGSVYTTLNRARHLLSGRAMWEVMTGDEAPGPVTRQMLIDELTRREAKVWGGMDFGFTHCFASVTGWQDGRRLFILDAFEIPGLEPNQCVETCDKRIKKFGATIYPDTAYPAYIKMFRRQGYRMNTHTKDVIGGIEVVRRKLNPSGNSEPEMFMLEGDEGCELLFKRLDEYKWMLDSQGNPTDVPDETNDDLCDACRYMVQNAFKNMKLTMAKNSPVALPEQEREYRESTWMSQKIQELTNGQSSGAPVQIKKGSFVFDG